MNSNSETRIENSDAATADVHNSSTRCWPTNMKELVDPDGPFIPKWNFIFIFSCVFSVLLDPLFLYIPIINDDIKCVRLHNNLKIAALVLRSATDLCYLLNIFLQVYSYSTNSSAKRTMRRLYILIDILAVLPIPQIIVLIFYFNMRGSRSFGTMNFFVLVQYVPRVLRIFLSCMEYSKKYSSEEIPIWLKGVLNFVLYILASHVMGAFWYFFAVQQITTCWQYACRLENGCVSNNLYCHDHHPLRNIKFLDDLCSVDPPNEKFFNFGIFLDILQLDILGSTNFFKKFSNCFSWGLRNLSSFGSNMKPSDNAWENLFAAFISIIGLLLFLYLIGNLQIYMQLNTTRLEALRWEKKIEKKMDKKRPEVVRWLSKNGIPLCKTPEIMVKVEVQLKEDKDVDVDRNILSILPLDLQNYMISCMPLNRLNQVEFLQEMDERVLGAISECLDPVKYTKNDIIIQEKEPLEKMIFIVEGHVIIKMRGCYKTLKRSTGQVYGEQLLSWPGSTNFPHVVPMATESVCADGDVEALILTASNMKDVGQKFRSSFSTNQFTHPKWELLESDNVTKLKEVPFLAKMDEGALRAVSEYFETKKYSKDDIIIHEEKSLEMMIFIVKGLVIIEMNDCSRTLKLSAGEVYGEKLLTWPTWTSFPSVLPEATESVRADGEVEALVLMANDIQDVVLKHKLPFFSEEITRLTDDDWELLETDRVHNLRKVPKLEKMKTPVLKAIYKKLKLQSFHKKDVGLRSVITKDKPLREMVFVTRGSLDLIKKGSNQKLNEGEFYGEELLDWVLDESFPAIQPISTHGVSATSNADVLVLTVTDLSDVVSKFKSHFSKVIDSSLDLCATVGLTWLKNGPSLIFQSMDEEVLKEISKHLKLMSYNEETYIVQENNSLEHMFIFVEGRRMSIESNRRPFKKGSHDIGHFYGDELVHWVTNWASHANFPDKLPSSTSSVKVSLRGGNAGVLVLQVDDLKSIVTKFMSHFIRKTTLLVDSEWKLSTFDPLATLRNKVPKLADVDEKMLEKIRCSLTTMRYNDMSPCIIEREFDKMFFIENGLVYRSSIPCHESTTSDKFIRVYISTSMSVEKAYCYSGNYCGHELLEWALRYVSSASDCSVPKSNLRVEAVGEVQALVLKAEDLIRIVSEFKLRKETADNEHPSVSEF